MSEDWLSDEGVFPDRWLRRAVDEGWIHSKWTILPDLIQPASLDLRLGERAYRLQCSFLPGTMTVEERLQELVIGELDLRDEGAILEPRCPYLIPLMEELRVPDDVRGRANPKSSTGRLDVFTRVITDRGSTFDDVRAGYVGPLFLEVVPLSFTVRVQAGLSLNQLRLERGAARIGDDDIRALHASSPLLFRDGAPVDAGELPLRQAGLFLSLRLGSGAGPVGYRAKRYSQLVDLSRTDHDPQRYWEEVGREHHGLVLEPGDFYLLMSAEAVSVPPTVAAEMAAYDPTSGELRSHYAGFFDPGFGFTAGDANRGSTAALEVRAHDVPFLIEEGQPVCKLVFERMAAPPDRLYGSDVGSNYQNQVTTLGKHFLGGPRPRFDTG